MSDLSLHRSLLRKEFERRIQKNPKYSLRAFAAHLELDPAALSRILAGKQALTPKSCARILKKVPWGPETRRRFLASVAREKEQATAGKLSSQLQAQSLRPSMTEIDAETFGTVADIHHLALAQLTECLDAPGDVAGLAARLGMPLEEAQKAVDRLIRVGILERAGGRLCRTKPHLTSADNSRTTEALRRYQHQIMKRAEESLDRDPIELRSMTGMIMAIDPDLIPEAKRKIEEFMADLCDTLESGKPRRVYQLGIQLFPVDSGAPGTG